MKLVTKWTIAVSALFLFAAVACEVQPREAVQGPVARTMASPAGVEFKSPDGTYSFAYPEGWTLEPLNQGMLLLAPAAEGNWQANIYFEPGSDPEARPMAQALSDLAANLSTVKADFQSIGIDTVATSGSSAGRLAYTHSDSGTKLLSWELIVPPPAGNNRLFITAATADALKEKYLPEFEAIVKSVRFNG